MPSVALGYCVRNSPSEGTSVLAITATYYFPKNHDPSYAQPRVAITHKGTQLIGTPPHLVHVQMPFLHHECTWYSIITHRNDMRIQKCHMHAQCEMFMRSCRHKRPPRASASLFRTLVLFVFTAGRTDSQ